MGATDENSSFDLFIHWLACERQTFLLAHRRSSAAGDETNNEHLSKPFFKVIQKSLCQQQNHGLEFEM